MGELLCTIAQHNCMFDRGITSNDMLIVPKFPFEGLRNANCRWRSVRDYLTLLMFVRSMLDFPLACRSISSLKPVNICPIGRSSQHRLFAASAVFQGTLRN